MTGQPGAVKGTAYVAKLYRLLVEPAPGVPVKTGPSAVKRTAVKIPDRAYAKSVHIKYPGHARGNQQEHPTFSGAYLDR